MTYFLLALVVVGTVSGDLLKASAMRRIGEVDDFRLGALGRLGRAMAASPVFCLSIGAYAVSFFGFMALVSITEVSFAVPATAAAYVVETVLARFVLQENITSRRWLGALLVACGVVMISL